jgi:hypothetical protein
MGIREQLKDGVPSASMKDRVAAGFKPFEEQVQAHFERQLEDLGLAKKQIESQSLDELQQSLETVNAALMNPQSFGTLAFKVSADVGPVLTSSKADVHFERGILQLLLSRKRLILERIRTLSASEKIESIQDLVNQVNDEAVRNKLKQEVASLKNESQSLREQSKDVDQKQTREAIRTQTELEQLKMELFERKSKVWFSLLERESAATLLGGFLLLVIAIAHVTAVFSKFSIPEILNNAFLIILGYFFGQSTSDKQKSKGGANES